MDKNQDQVISIEPQKDFVQDLDKPSKFKRIYLTIIFLIVSVIIILIAVCYLFITSYRNNNNLSNIAKELSPSNINNQLERDVEVSKANVVKTLIRSEVINESDFQLKYEQVKDSRVMYFMGSNGKKIYPPQKIVDIISSNYSINSDGTYILLNHDQLLTSKDSNILILSNISFDEEGLRTHSNCTGKIYSYDISKKKLTQFYEEKSPNCNGLRLMGTQGSKLIIETSYFDNSPGPCSTFWLGMGDIKYIELSDVASGLHEFTVPLSKTNEMQRWQANCEKDLYSREDQK